MYLKDLIAKMMKIYASPAPVDLLVFLMNGSNMKASNIYVIWSTIVLIMAQILFLLEVVDFPQKSRQGQAQSFSFCFSYSAGQR